MNLYSSNEMKELLERHGFFFKKNLGQNFLMNESIAKRIASSSRETVSGKGKTLALEIGPGAGSLTLQLSKLFDQVIALEIDPHLLTVLEESLGGTNNVKVINTDALVYPYGDLIREYPDYRIAVCSNLPYYITSELIMRFLEANIPLDSITVLIQKEACNRLISPPGSPDYGAITAAVSYYSKAEKLFTVGPGNFIPRPKVDSAVLRLTPYETPPVTPCDVNLFFRIIRAAFSARRKTLLNALASFFQQSLSKDEIISLLDQCGVDHTRRGETLRLEEFCEIANQFSKRNLK